MEAKVAQFSEAVAAARGGDADAAVRAVLANPAEPTDVAALPLEEVFVKWTERTPPLEATSYAVSQPLGSAGVREHQRVAGGVAVRRRDARCGRGVLHGAAEQRVRRVGAGVAEGVRGGLLRGAGQPLGVRHQRGLREDAAARAASRAAVVAVSVNASVAAVCAAASVGSAVRVRRGVHCGARPA